MGNFFGTDGIRGVFGQSLTTSLVMSVGNALTQTKKNPNVLIGSDTRTSSDILISALSTGIMQGGGNVVSIKVVPTACVAYLTKLLNFDYGIMVSASHNPACYNGIKVFKSNGQKMTDEEEEYLENFIGQNYISDMLGSFQEKNLSKHYIDHLKSVCTHTLKNLKICIDASNGSAYKIAPLVFKNLGATVYCTACKNDGKHINDNCGSLHVENLQEFVKSKNADIGFAFDGDADRLIAVDGNGEIFDGDKILYILAKDMKKENKLYANTIVGTSHTNSGIMTALNKNKINLIRTDIGDKYVIDAMEKMNLVLGGEQSGHIIIRTHATTGDGILTALCLSDIIAKTGKSLSSLFDAKLMPQVNINLVVKDKIKIINNEQLINLISHLSNDSRILVRASGTENKIRIMVENTSASKAKSYAKQLKNMILQI